MKVLIKLALTILLMLNVTIAMASVTHQPQKEESFTAFAPVKTSTIAKSIDINRVFTLTPSFRLNQLAKADKEMQEFKAIEKQIAEEQKKKSKKKKSYMDNIDRTKRYVIVKNDINLFSFKSDVPRLSRQKLAKAHAEAIGFLERPHFDIITDLTGAPLGGPSVAFGHSQEDGSIKLYSKKEINRLLIKKITDTQYQCLLTMEKTINSKIKNGSTQGVIDFNNSFPDKQYNLADAGCTGADNYVLNETELQELTQLTAERYLDSAQKAALEVGIDIYQLPFNVALACLDLWYQGGFRTIFGKNTPNINNALRNGDLYAFLNEVMYGSNSYKLWQTDFRNAFLTAQVTELIAKDSTLTPEQKIIAEKQIIAFKKHISVHNKALYAIRRISHLVKKTPRPLTPYACSLVAKLLDDTNWRGKQVSYQLVKNF